MALIDRLAEAGYVVRDPDLNDLTAADDARQPYTQDVKHNAKGDICES